MRSRMGQFRNTREGLALVFGVIAIVSSLLFFLHKSGLFILNLVEEIPDMYFMYFFAGLTVVSGIIHLLTTLGFISS